jgi:hypothetical protein
VTIEPPANAGRHGTAGAMALHPLINGE